MMRRLLGAIVSVTAILWTSPAAAQAPGNVDGRRVTLGGVIGAGAVQEVGVQAGGTLGIRLTQTLELVGEGIWTANTATRRRINLASNVGTYLQTTQGTQVSATVEAPTVFAGGGLRLLFGSRRWRPYAVITAGVARITLQPEVTVGGGDITSRLSEYGVTLGRDLAGSMTEPAVSGGFGLRTRRSDWFVDAGIRYIYIQTDGQATGVIGIGSTVGRAF